MWVQDMSFTKVSIRVGPLTVLYKDTKVHDLRFTEIWDRMRSILKKGVKGLSSNKVRVKGLSSNKVRVKDLSSNKLRVKDQSSHKVRVQNLSHTRYGHRICPIQGTGTTSVLYKVRVQNLSYTR